MSESTATQGAAPIETEPNYCLDRHHSSANCRYCVTSCPAGAITLLAGNVQIDHQICTGCGLCLATCPTEVFNSRTWSERHILDHLPELSNHPAELVCGHNARSGTQDPEAAALQVRVCLAAISPGLWYEAARTRTITVRMDACPDCEWSAAAPYIERAVDLARDWLAASGCEQNLALVRTAQTGPIRSRPVIDANTAFLSRRDFMFGFARGGSLLAVLTGQAARAGRRPVDEAVARRAKVTRHQPVWRRHLAGAYSDTSAESGQAALWPQLSITPRCTACRGCEQYCPTGALRSELTASQFTLTFNAGQCVDCGLCALSCPREAVTKGYEHAPRPFERQVVFQAIMEQCVRCKMPSVGVQNHLCHWCAEEPSLDSVLEDAKHRLFSRPKATRS